MSQQDIKQIVAQEYIKCAKDPAYFMRKYCYIQHPKRGRILFNLYPFQESVLHLFRDENYIITLKSRQLGISTLAAGYSLWLMLFHKDKNVLALAITQATARNLVTKTIFMYDNLPKWLQLPFTERNKLSLRLKNGSKITAKSSNTDAARSEAVSLLLIDEAAFIDNIEKIYTAAQQTLATGGRCIALSTPNGVGNWFHKTFTQAQLGENSFCPVSLPWTVHPERDQNWRDQQTKDLGVRGAAQECDCDFSTSGNTVLEPDTLNYFQENFVKDPEERRGADKGYWIWNYPDPMKTYVVVADVARGDGADFSTFHVIDIDEVKQVAEYKGQPPTKEFAKMLVSVAIEWNSALLVIENASIGWDVVTTVVEQGYPNLYYSPKSEMVGTQMDLYVARFDKGDGMVPGFAMNQRTRPLVIEKFRSFMEERTVVIQSQRLLDELRVFIWKAGVTSTKAQALQGYNDDLTMAWATGLFLRDTAFRFRKTAVDLAYASLNSFSKTTNNGFQVYNGGGYNNYGQDNPWKMEITNGEQTDLTWLL